MIRSDLDWQFAGMTAEEQPIDWLDRVHPVCYGYPVHGPRRYLWGVSLAMRTGPVERYKRCPTCEEWSPCTVRERLLPLIRAGHAVASEPGTQTQSKS